MFALVFFLFPKSVNPTSFIHHLPISISELAAEFQDLMQRWRSHCGVHFTKPAPLLCRSLWARHSSSKLFVGGLSYDTNETVLKDAFQQHGQIIQVRIICDRVSGKSRGYGFVQFDSEATASKALNQMNAQMVDGRSIRVSYAHK